MPEIRFEVQHSAKSLVRDLNFIERQAVPKATRAALNRTATSLRAAAVRAMAKDTGLKQKDIRAGMKIHKATGNNLSARIVARGRPFNLIRFNARQAKKWVSARPWRKLRKYRRNVFIGNDGRTVFKRLGAGHGAPIRGMYGPGIAAELIREAVTKAVDERFDERWPVEFGRALENELRKRGFR